MASSLGVISLTLTGEADLTRKEMVSSPSSVHTGWGCAGEKKKLECWAGMQLNLARNGAKVFVPLCLSAVGAHPGQPPVGTTGMWTVTYGFIPCGA